MTSFGFASGRTAPVVPTVVYPPHELKPGQTLAVEIPTAQSSFKRPFLKWNDETVPFYQSRKKNWRALRQVPLDAPPGETTLVAVQVPRGINKPMAVPFKIQVAASDFGFETIRFPKDKATLLNDPSEDEESQLIRETLARLQDDDEQLWQGLFEKPIPGRLLSPFGIRRNKVGQKKPDFHRGVDLAGPAGQPIVAPNAGRVVLIRDFKFHGRTVLLSHGHGVGSLYIHMKVISVQEGQRVKKGQKLGEVGSSGLATAPHLHWGLYVLGQPVDPLQWLEIEF